MMAQTALLAALFALAAAPTEYRIAIEHSPRRITVTSGDRVVKETPCAEESLFQALHTGMNAIHAESRVGGTCLFIATRIPTGRAHRQGLARLPPRLPLPFSLPPLPQPASP